MKMIHLIQTSLIILFCIQNFTAQGRTAVTGNVANLDLAPTEIDSLIFPRRNQIDLDIGFLTIGVAYSVRQGRGWSLGFGADFGPNLLNHMVVSGEHFATASGWSYDGNSADSESQLAEFIGLNVFGRKHVSSHFHLDLGLRASLFLHNDDSGNLAGGISYGFFTRPTFGKGWFKAGPRLFMGVLTEGNDLREFGIHVTWITLQIAFGK